MKQGHTTVESYQDSSRSRGPGTHRLLVTMLIAAMAAFV